MITALPYLGDAVDVALVVVVLVVGHVEGRQVAREREFRLLNGLRHVSCQVKRRFHALLDLGVWCSLSAVRGIRKALRTVRRKIDAQVGASQRYPYNAGRAGIVGGIGYLTRMHPNWMHPNWGVVLFLLVTVTGRIW
jgi:hypothetical protein